MEHDGPHQWIETTTLAAREQEFTCARCPATYTQPHLLELGALPQPSD